MYYDTANGTATAGLEYVAACGSVTIAAGATTSESFPVTILDDGYEPNDDDFYTALDGASGASIAWGSPASVCVSIQNTDAEPCASVSGPQSVQEANTAWFQIALSGTSNVTTSIYFDTVRWHGHRGLGVRRHVRLGHDCRGGHHVPVDPRDHL